VSNAAVIMFGGIETTEGTLLNAVWYLLREPDLFAAVVDDPGLVPAAVEESLRIEPAAAVVDRYATRDVELAGTAIPGGSHVTVSLTGANRDPPCSLIRTTSRSTARSGASTSPSPPARTCASGWTSPGWRSSPP
jgi:cytochrome P450